MAIRTDLLEQIGEKNPDTWEDWLRIGKKGKAIGHPFGTALGHSVDANTTLLSILFSYQRLVQDWRAQGYSDEVLEQVFWRNAERFLLEAGFKGQI